MPQGGPPFRGQTNSPATTSAFNWLVVHQVVPRNPAAVVWGPRLSVTEGSTPALEAADVARIIDGIPTDTL